MNPGAGVPVATAHIPIVTHACQIPQMAVWLPTIPDATQAQIVLLMEALDCGRAIVVNLTDVCEPDSSALGPRVTALVNNTPRWDSLFHAPRHAELNNLLAAGPYVAMIGGWTKVFFGERSLTGGAVGAAAMIGTGAAYVERASRVDGLAAAAGVPFTAWVAFATVLGEEIRRRNPS